MFYTMTFETERNLMATERRKVVVNLHPVEKIRNHCYVYYILEKHFHNRLCYKIIKEIKNFNNIVC